MSELTTLSPYPDKVFTPAAPRLVGRRAQRWRLMVVIDDDRGLTEAEVRRVVKAMEKAGVGRSKRRISIG